MGPQFFVDGGFVCTYKGITRLLGRGSVRITPARAGKSQKPPGRWSPRRDHPRTRGEKLSLSVISLPLKGSPPHTRGKVSDLENLNFDLRITPAHTGKSMVWKALLTSGRDHPRTHGEKPPPIQTGRIGIGSPPHTRGKVSHRIYVGNLAGITPARAGKRTGYKFLGFCTEDHPRACGEKGNYR